MLLGLFLGWALMPAPVWAEDDGEDDPGDTCGNDDDDDDEDDCDEDDEDEDDDDGDEDCDDVCCEDEPDHECCDDDDEDEDEPECDEEDGGGNRFRAYSGNVRRTINDLALADGVGTRKLAFKRTTTSRWIGGIPTPMGSGGNWRHSYYWHITEQLDTNGLPVCKNGGPVLVVNSPNGVQKQFDLDSTNSLYFTARAKTKERILRSSADTNQYYLMRLDGTRHAFYRGTNGVYVMQGFYDRRENFYAFEYDGQARLTRVLDPLTNHWLAVEYATPTNFIQTGSYVFAWSAPGAASVSVAGSFNGWSTAANPLAQGPDGVWTGSVALASGTHEYKFVIDGGTWQADTNNPYYNTFNNGNSVLYVGWEQLTRAYASDGREVFYRYGQMAVDGIAHACLEHVDYGDGTSAHYTYDPPATGKYWRPMLASADDPMKSGVGARIAYSYQRQTDTNAGPVGVSGMIFEERNLETSNLIARLVFDPLDPGTRIIENGDGTSKYLYYPTTNQGRVAVVTNAAGYVTRREYFSGFGMMSTFVNARGVTNRYSLTAEFGATTAVSNQFGVRSKTYTDNEYPAYVASKTDRAGRQTSYYYDDSNRLERVVKPNGREQTFTRNQYGQVLEKSDCCGGGPETLEYDCLGRLIRRTDATGVTESYGHDTFGRVAFVTNAAGGVTQYQFNWRGDATNILYPDNTSESFAYDRNGRVTNHVTRTGGQEITTYDEYGNVATRQDALGHVTTYVRDMKGRPLVTTFPNGLVVSNAYDALGRKTVEFLPHNGAISTWQYGISGVTSHTDRAGATTTYEYDQRGRLIRKTDALGHATGYGYDAQGNVAYVTNALGGVARTLYDLNDRVVARYNEMDELVVTNAYDTMGRLVWSQNQAGLVVSNAYDTSGRVLARFEDGVMVFTNTYDYAGRLAIQTDAAGLTVSNAYDLKGNLVSRNYSSDSTTEYWVYDGYGLREHINRVGHTNRFDYDAAGRQIRMTDALGHETAYALNADGKPTAITNALGEVVQRTYDLEGNPIALFDAEGQVTQSNTYDVAGRLIYSVNALDVVTERKYDLLGQQTNILHAGWVMSDVQYDGLRRPVLRTDANGVTISNTYDAVGRLVAVTMPDSTYSQNIYTNGQLWKQVDRAGRVTEYLRDSHNRVTNQVDNAGQTVQFRYDVSGNLTNLVDQAGNNTFWTYDAEGRQTRKTYADATHWDYTYDAAGRLASRTDAKNQTTHYQYDAVGNLTNINYPNDADVSFTYDALNRKTTMTDGIGSTTYAYSSCCGLQESEDGPFANDTLYFGYTDAKQLASVTSSFLNVRYAYDDLQRLRSVVGPEGTNTYFYEGAGTAWRDLQLGNGTAVSRHYDELMRLTNMVNATDAGVLSSFALTVDDADQRTQVVREDGTRYDYSYDAIGQLTNASATLAYETPWQAYQYGYQYDNTGNPLEQDKNGLVYSNSFNNLNQNVATVPGGSLAVLGRVNYAGGTVAVNLVQAQLSPDLIFAATGIPFTLGTNALNTVFTDPFGRSTNRETSVVVAQKAYQYDANGNLTNDGRMAYFWNDENRLVAVRDAKTGALIQENRYDGLGRRRERLQSAGSGGDDPGSTNRYIYHDWLVLAVTDGEGNVLETYTHGADLSGQVGGGAGGIGGILASTQASGPAYYHYDFNGNVVNVCTSNQTQLAKYTFSPFGEVLLKEGEFNSRYQFSTKEYDSITGLNYYGYRFYAPDMGRWISRDPAGERGGVDLYCFIDNELMNFVDSFGGKKTSGSSNSGDNATEHCAAKTTGPTTTVPCPCTPNPNAGTSVVEHGYYFSALVEDPPGHFTQKKFFSGIRCHYSMVFVCDSNTSGHTEGTLTSEESGVFPVP